MQVTISEFTFPYNGAATNLELRAYARVSYTTSGGVSVPKGFVDTDEYVVAVAITVTDGIATVPSFNIYSTIDGTPDYSYYTFLVYDGDGDRIYVLYDNLVIPAQSPITIETLAEYNDTRCANLPDEYFTRDQILALLADREGSVPVATTVVQGKVRLNFAADDPADPIVIGENWPPALVLAERRYLEEWTDDDLAQAITDIGATPTILVISKPSQYVATGALQTAGPLVVDKIYQIVEYNGDVEDTDLLTGGTGYAVANGIGLTGGTGTGAAIDITFVVGGIITGYTISNPGSGYTVGDRLYANAGDVNAIFEVKSTIGTDQFQNVGWTAGHNDAAFDYRFFNSPGTVFKATGTTPTTWSNLSALRPYLVVPENITLEFEANGSLGAENYGGIFIYSMIPPGRRQVFALTGEDSSILVHPRAVPRELNLSWWAGRTSSGNDTRALECLRDSAGFERLGAEAHMPSGKWLTSRCIEWTSNVTVSGAGYALDPIGTSEVGAGTVIAPYHASNLAQTYTSVFSMQQRPISLTFRDFTLWTRNSQDTSAFRWVMNMSGGYNVFWDKVHFYSVAPDPQGAKTMILDGTGSWHEFINFNLYDCIWTTGDETSALYWRSTNNGGHIHNPHWRVGVKSKCLEAPAIGFTKVSNADPRGQGGYTIEESTNRTMPDASITIGTNILTLDDNSYTAGRYFTQEDVGRYVVENTALPSPGATGPKYYIYKLNSPWEAVLMGGPNGGGTGDGTAEATLTADTITIEDHILSDEGVADCVFDIGFSIGFHVDGGADEGFKTTLRFDSADQGSQIQFSNYTGQGLWHFLTGSLSMQWNNCKVFSKSVKVEGSPRLLAYGGSVLPYVFGGDADRFPYPGQIIHRGDWFAEVGNEAYFVFDNSRKIYDTGSEFDADAVANWFSDPVMISDPLRFGGPVGDEVPLLSILSPSTNEVDVKSLVRIGRSNWGNPQIPLYYYDFKWRTYGANAGALDIVGNQSGYVGLMLNGYIQSEKGLYTHADDPGGVGYAPGTGDAVVQDTNKSTGVTVNCLSGQITMNNANLVAGASVTFFVTNSMVRTNQVPLAVHLSGGTLGSYDISCHGVINLNGFYIKVKNNTHGDLAEAIVLQFILFNGAV